MIDVALATARDRELVGRLAQLYQYDFTEFDDNDVDPNGEYTGIHLDPFFEDEDRFVYVLRVEGEIAGFALVTDAWSLLGEGDHFMAEFFVMRRFRRGGAGTSFARDLFDRHPGVWEVAQLRRNTPALAFWRKVIGSYTHGAFEEHDLDTDEWDGTVQVFTA